MEFESLARRTAVLGRMLLAASLLLVLVWWRASVYLFVAGLIAYGLASMLDDEALPALFTAQE